MRIINAYANYDTNDVFLVIRDGDKKTKKVIRGEYPYICIERKNLYNARVQEKVDKKYIREVKDDGIYAKLYVQFAGMIPKLRDELEGYGIKTYEGDLPFARRVMIDKKIMVGSEPLRFLFVDIETDDTEKVIKVGEYPILSIACMGLDGVKKFFCTDDEKTTLSNFYEVMKEYDVLVAWNGDGFDFPYLEMRFKKFGIKADWREYQRVDDMFLVAKGYEKLQEAGSKYVKMSKLEHEGRKIIDLYKNDRTLLMEYNIRDVEIMFEIEKKLNLLKLNETLSERSNCFLEDLKYPTTIVDTMILYKVKELGLNLRFPHNAGGVKESFEGGFVLEPKRGLHKNIIVLDFTSLYNRIMQTFNISPETIGGGEIFIPDSRITFSKKKGIIPYILETLEEDRNTFKRARNKSEQGSEEYKKNDLLQNAVKVVLLSFYGVMGTNSRYYNRDVAESVTRVGRYLAKESQKIIEDQGFEVLYMDTDSLMIKYHKDGDVIEEGKALCNLLNESYKSLLQQFKVFPEMNKIEMKFEKVFSKIIMVGSEKTGTKKRYAALQTWEEGNLINKINIVGLEYVRRDWSKFARQMQKEIIDKILLDDMDFITLHKFVNDKKDYVVDRKLTMDEVVIKQGLTQAIEKYKVKIPHVRVAIRMLELGEEVVIGQRIPYVIVEGGLYVPISEYKEDYDIMYYWNNKIYPPTERILSSVFSDVDWKQFYIPKKKKSGQKKKKEEKPTQTLNDFFPK